MKEGDDFPPGDKTLRKEDHQAFLREFIFEIKGGKHHIIATVPKDKTMFPPACKLRLSLRVTVAASFRRALPGRRRPGKAPGADPAHRGPDHPLRRAGLRSTTSTSPSGAARSARSSGRTEPARAPSSIA